MGVGDISRRILVGRRLRSSQSARLLPKRVALPVLASDALSSVAYAPDEIFIILSLVGASAYTWSWKVALAVAVVMFAVLASYRQQVIAYPSGGGDYQVARTNLGATAGTTVASALVVDYVLTVAVSISSGAQYAAAAVPWLMGHEVIFACLMVLCLAAVNLRGIRGGSGAWLAVPTYAFIIAVLGMAVLGLVQYVTGTLPDVASADYDIVSAPGYDEPLTTAALVFLLARAFSSGCVALTGVEAISAGVPEFRKPRGHNAATTLAMLGAIAITMMVSVVVLARQMGVRAVDPSDLDRLRDAAGQRFGEDFTQSPVIAQIAEALFADFPPGFYLVVSVAGVVLVLAANTAFNGFPALGSILARDGYAPRALGARGGRLAYSNGIVFLSVLAIVLIVAFEARTTQLIQLYIVGVFVSFTLSQLGMVRHWTRLLAVQEEPGARGRMQRARVTNAVGLVLTAVVLVVVLVTKFLQGAWITVLVMALLFALMRGVHAHYTRVGEELAIADEDRVLPTRVHAVVLVAKLHKPTLRALAYAKATRPNVLEAVYVSVDPDETQRLLVEWDQRNLGVPLKVLHSPYRELVRPIIEYAVAIRRANPRGVVAVYIPEYVVGHWWEQLLHNQTALRLKGRLLFTPGVMVTSVPYQLRSSEAALARARHEDELRR